MRRIHERGDNDRSPIRSGGRVFRFANAIRAKLNLTVWQKSTNFIDLESVEDEFERARERARRNASEKARWWFEKELRGLGLNANRAGALWAEGPELKGPGERPRDIASALCCALA